MRCVVLGGGGFIGAHVVRQLTELGHQVTSVGRCAVPAARRVVNCTYVAGDFRDETLLDAILPTHEVCFHLVSTTVPHLSNKDPRGDVESNLGGSLLLMEKCLAYGIRRLVFSSSGGTVYGPPMHCPITEQHPTEPICSYGITKLAIEKYLGLYRTRGLDSVSLRISNPYGDGQSTSANQGAVAVFLGRILREEPIELWGDGSIVRDFLHVEDVARALVLSATYEGGEPVMNIGSGIGTSISELIEVIGSLVGKTVSITRMAGRACDVPASILATTLARRELGWVPTIDLHSGVSRFAKSLRDFDVRSLRRHG